MSSVPVKVLFVMSDLKGGGAERVVIGSREIAACERHDLRKPLSVSLQFVPESVEFAEWFYSNLDSAAGEEIVFIASKEKTDTYPGRARVEAI